MTTINVKAEGYNLIVIDDTPVDSTFRVEHSRYKYANIHYWGTSKIKLLALDTEARNEVIDDANICVVNSIVPTWCYGLTQWGHNNDVEKVDLYKDSIYDTSLLIREVFVNENAIELNDGKFLIRDFGKYGSHLLVIDLMK